MVTRRGKETVMATITRINRRTQMIDMRTPDGRKLSMHKLMLIAAGLDCTETIRVKDRVRCVVQTAVRVDYWVIGVTGVAPAPVAEAAQ